MLTGPDVSPIQNYASVILDVIEVLATYNQEIRELKLALVASGNADPTELFDELRDVETDDSAELADEEDSVQYDFSNAEFTRSQEEVEREIAEMLAAASSGTATFEDPTLGEWL